MHGIKNLMLLDRCQTEISTNKGKCFKKEKEAGYFHDNVLITTKVMLELNNTVKCLRDARRY